MSPGRLQFPSPFVVRIPFDSAFMLRRLLELIRFSHTVFALPFALLAALLAWAYRAEVARQAANEAAQQAGWRWIEFLGIVLCMVFARSAAMAFNRAVDHKLDAANPRTLSRHLPAGLVSLKAVGAFVAVASLGFVASTLLFLPNRWPLVLAVPVLAFICGYSFAKRFTAAAHFWLGTALFLAPVCTWIAIVGFEGILPAIVLGGAVLFWVAGFDIIYACQDEATDRQQGLHSVPAALGTSKALRLAAVCHLFTIGLLASLPWVYTSPGLGWVFLAGVGAVAVLLVYEHLLVRPDDLTRVNVAFFQVNAIVSIGLFVVGALDLALRLS